MTAGAWARWTVTIAVVVALFVPVIRDQDSFPLSTQPMYATARDSFEWLPSARGVDGGTGGQRRLSMALVAETDDPLIAESRLEQAIRSGRAMELCEEIAARVAVDPDLRRINLVEVLTEHLDLIGFVADDAAPVGTQVHARCGVAR